MSLKNCQTKSLINYHPLDTTQSYLEITTPKSLGNNKEIIIVSQTMISGFKKCHIEIIFQFSKLLYQK